jgi:hypothetical protein
MAWSATDRPVRAPGVVAGLADGHLVVMQTLTGEFAGIEGTGLRLWELVAEGLSVRELVATLMAEYAVSRGECAPAVVEWLETLRRAGVVTVE